MTVKTSPLIDAIEVFGRHGELEPAELENFFEALISETNEEVLRDIFVAWNAKGISENELFALASRMRKRCVPVRSQHPFIIDSVGTGGSRVKTFNVSTAAAFVIAGAGFPVAKHGNRAATSSSGSADVLSQLGVQPAVDAAKAEQCLSEIGICFIFAPNFHRLSPTLATVRRGLGFPTIFNLVGPLCNPARATHQVIGVWKEDLIDVAANVISRLGTEKTWVVHGSDGLDEITLRGPTRVAEITAGTIKGFSIDPSDVGIATKDLADARADSPANSASTISKILAEKITDTPAAELVMINAAAAIDLVEARGMRHAYNLARESVASGAAFEKLQSLAALTNR